MGGGSVGRGRRVNRVGKEKVGRGRKKNSSRTRGCWRWRKDKRLTVSNARCGRSWAPNMVVGFRGMASVDGGGDSSKGRRAAALAGCRVAGG